MPTKDPHQRYQLKPSQTQPAAVESRAPLAYAGSRQQAQAQRIAQLKGDSAAEAKIRNELPAQLRAGVEQLSGTDLSDVTVHRNSARPAELGALAYAKGNEIHLGPGHDAHLPHEAWHIAQQRQGRVRANTGVGQVPVNDDPALEREADIKGQEALRQGQQAMQLKQAPQVAQFGKEGKKGLTKARAKQRRIRDNKDRPDNRVWIPSGEVGHGDPPEGFSTWAEWIHVKQLGEKMK